MRKQLKTTVRWLCIGICFVSMAIGGCMLPSAEAGAEFSSASLQGRYALNYMTGPYAASGVGICEFDGNGSHVCDFIDSSPNPEKEFTRRIKEYHADGNYTINPDGRIQAVHRPTYADGRVIDYPYELVVTQAETFGDHALIEEISGYSSVPAGNFSVLATVNFSRIPAVAFDNASVKGTYAAQYAVEPNIASGVGYCEFKGDGTYACTFADNSPNPENMAERNLSTIPITGTLTMEPTGRATSVNIQVEHGQEYRNPYDWVVTKAEEIGPNVVVTELVGNSQLSAGEATDFLVTVSLKRVSDD